MTMIDEGPEAVAFELFRTPEGRANPYPRYHTLRSLAPVHYSEVVRGWVLTRYEDCNAVLRDPRFIRGYAVSLDQRRPNWRERRALVRGERTLLNLDGPAHTRLRKLVARAFTPRSVERLRPAVEVMVDEPLDRLAAAGGGDLMTELAFPLPVRVIGELLGVPDEDRARFRDLAARLTVVFEMGNTSEQWKGAEEAGTEIDRYFTALIASKRARPADDLLSALLAVDDGGDRLSDGELVSLSSLLFVAGFETTTNLIGNGILALLNHPDQIALLRGRPELFANLPDELLRYDGTVQLVTRLASEAVEVGGALIETNETVFPLLGAANHDPARYDDPDRLDVTRTDIRPLSFGGGIHYCLGAALARLETEIVFRKLISRFGIIDLDGLAPRRDRLSLRGPDLVPVVLGSPRARPAAPNEAMSALRARPTGESDAAWRAAFRAKVDAAGPPDRDELVERVALLRRVPLLRVCMPEELEELAGTAYPIAFDPGDVLCSEGAEPGECYIIAAGEALAVSGDRVLATIGANDVVGERGPLLGVPRAATVTAASHLLTYAISQDALRCLGERRPSLAASMREQVEQRYHPSACVTEVTT
jgi:cytochrome P450